VTAYRWAIIAALLVGAALGVGAFTFVYARGASYLTSDPAACANCHIMQEHFSGWVKSSHRSVATCNDCHTPHNNIVAKYATKASNGFWHSLGFTTGRFPDPLRIKPGNHRITEHACRYCHAEITDAIEHGTDPGGETPERDKVSCVRCHKYVGHWVR
jgi:cytochrome c nitrite reductase small subunit